MMPPSRPKITNSSRLWTARRKVSSFFVRASSNTTWVQIAQSAWAKSCPRSQRQTPRPHRTIRHCLEQTTRGCPILRAFAKGGEVVSLHRRTRNSNHARLRYTWPEKLITSQRSLAPLLHHGSFAIPGDRTRTQEPPVE